MTPKYNPSLRRGLIFSLIFTMLATLSPATTVLPPDFNELVNRSDFVVRARIKSSEPELRISGDRRRIFTKVELEVLEVIAGEPPASIVLELLGGRIEDEEMIVDGMPRLRVGTESVLFVKDNGRVLCPIYAMNYGVYPVEEEPTTKQRYMTRGNKIPLEQVAEVAQPLTEGDELDVPALRRKRSNAFTPEEFSREIKAVRSLNTL